VAFREPIKALVDGHGRFHFTVNGICMPLAWSCFVDSRPAGTAPLKTDALQAYGRLRELRSRKAD
jgi:hypothetical protein